MSKKKLAILVIALLVLGLLAFTLFQTFLPVLKGPKKAGEPPINVTYAVASALIAFITYLFKGSWDIIKSALVGAFSPGRNKEQYEEKLNNEKEYIENLIARFEREEPWNIDKFTDLEALNEGLDTAVRPVKVKRFRTAAGSGDVQVEEQLRSKVSIRTFLEKERKNKKPIMIKGEPGSGKTILARRYAADIAKSAKERIVGWRVAPTLLPMYVTLNAYNTYDSKGNVEPFLDFLKNHLKTEFKFSTYVVENLEKLLVSGRLMLVLDGLNEMPPEDSAKRVANIEQFFTKDYPKNQYIITCRNIQFTSIFRYNTLEINELNDGQIKQFIKAYKGEDEVERIFGELKLDTGIPPKRFRNPFILRIFLLTEEVNQRPSSLGQLYRAHVDEKLKEFGDEREELIKKLKLIAFCMSGGGLFAGYIDIDVLEQKLQIAIDEDFLTKCQKANIIDLSTPGKFRFFHQIFQEYFSALVLDDLFNSKGDYRVFLTEKNWEEIVLVWGGIASDPQEIIQELVRSVTKKAKQIEDKDGAEDGGAEDGGTEDGGAEDGGAGEDGEDDGGADGDAASEDGADGAGVEEVVAEEVVEKEVVAEKVVEKEVVDETARLTNVRRTLCLSLKLCATNPSKVDEELVDGLLNASLGWLKSGSIIDKVETLKALSALETEYSINIIGAALTDYTGWIREICIQILGKSENELSEAKLRECIKDLRSLKDLAQMRAFLPTSILVKAYLKSWVSIANVLNLFYWIWQYSFVLLPVILLSVMVKGAIYTGLNITAFMGRAVAIFTLGFTLHHLIQFFKEKKRAGSRVTFKSFLRELVTGSSAYRLVMIVGLWFFPGEVLGIFSVVFCVVMVVALIYACIAFVASMKRLTSCCDYLVTQGKAFSFLVLIWGASFLIASMFPGSRSTKILSPSDEAKLAKIEAQGDSTKHSIWRPVSSKPSGVTKAFNWVTNNAFKYVFPYWMGVVCFIGLLSLLVHIITYSIYLRVVVRMRKWNRMQNQKAIDGVFGILEDNIWWPSIKKFVIGKLRATSLPEKYVTRLETYRDRDEGVMVELERTVYELRNLA